jgi:HEAT repeat protein
MKRFISAVCFCSFLLLLGLYFLSPPSEAKNDVLTDLLNLPAPPPPNPFVKDWRAGRPVDFYDPENPPKDDAPIEDLLDYWQRQDGSRQRLGYTPKPSEETLRRLLKECDDDPEKISGLVGILPADENIAERVKHYYDEELNNKKFGDGWQRPVRDWLTYNSKFFVDKLIKKARAVKDEQEYVTNQDELLALAKVDWDSAEPIIDRLLEDSGQPVSNTLAKWASYKHALEKNDATDIDKFRNQLKAVVEDKTALPGKRDLAFDALVKEGDWDGRDEWYLSLLEDETLAELKVHGQVYTGLTTLVLSSPPKKYAHRMLELLKSDNQVVRSAALRNLSGLITARDPEVLGALLPWLSNPKWAKEIRGERSALVVALREIKMPESVPGLIAMLNEKVVLAPRVPADSDYSANANSAMTAANRAVVAVERAMNAANSTHSLGSFQGDMYPYRDPAVYALSAQKDARAVAALHAVLPQVGNDMRGAVVRALWNSGGFSVPDQVNSIETMIRSTEQIQRDALNSRGGLSNVATIYNSPDDAYRMDAYSLASSERLSGPYQPMMGVLLLGNLLMNETEVSDQLVSAVIDRMETLQRSDPQMAAALRSVAKRWHGPAMNIFALRELKKGTLDIDLLIRLLSKRKELRETLVNEVFNARQGKPLAHGIAACLLEDQSEYEKILTAGDLETKTALLGCARMIRAELPLQKVAEDLKSPDKLLFLAAERYLESEDSPAARQIVLSHFPDSMKILGARTDFDVAEGKASFDEAEMSELFESIEPLPGAGGGEAQSYIPLDQSVLIGKEKKLKKEFDEDKELLGVYGYNGNYIRLYSGRAVFSWEEDNSRYRERPLKKEEFDNFTGYLRNENVEALPPFLSDCGGEEGCDGTEFLMLGRAGGRRIYFRGESDSNIQKDLDAMFAEMRKAPAKLHYWMEKYVPGLEILFADDRLKVRTLWRGAGDDLRLLIEDSVGSEKMEKEFQRAYGYEDNADEQETDEGQPIDPQKRVTAMLERIKVMQKEVFSWRKFSGGELGDIAAVPPGIDSFDSDRFLERPDPSRWKARAGNLEIQASADGLYKVAGGIQTKLQAGVYSAAVVTPNGRWAIAEKTIEYKPVLVRVNLQTNKEYIVQLPESMRIEPVVYIPALNRTLIFTSKSYYDGIDEGGDEGGDPEGMANSARQYDSGQYFLLDAETGAALEIRNDVRPLQQQTFRPLQPAAGKPDIFWAVIADPDKRNTRFGLYNTKTLLFNSLLTIPEIQFGCMDTWVNESEGKIYFVYEGQLLRLPMPKPGP